MLRECGQTSTTSCNIQNVARKIWPFSNLSQHHPTCCNILQHGGQTCATCCAQQCCKMLRWNVASVWPGLYRNALDYALSSKVSNVEQLKPVQEEALFKFVEPRDVFCVLPTSCGKSSIFQLVPLVCAYLHKEGFDYPKKPILSVIFPLSSLVESHIQELANYGISSCYLGGNGLVKDDVLQQSVVFTSPELAAREERWRKFLLSREFQDNVFGLVTDEAHLKFCSLAAK